MSETTMTVSYRVRAGADEIEARAEGLLLEQTVELPRAAAERCAFVRDQIIGRTVSIEPLGDGEHRVTLEQPLLATGDDPAQFLNVLFGNSSLQPDVLLEDCHLPEAFAATLGGPRFGLAGIREATGARNRPLTSTALKPMGLPPAAIADLCRTFALAGIDVIKDDHGLADHGFCRFQERVTACVAAIREAAEETGRASVYAPNLIGTPDAVRRQMDFARQAGADMVMVSPMLLGMPVFAELIAREPGVPVLAHPAFGGAVRISPELLLGKLFRLFGADAVIYPNFGGRFTYSREVCATLAGNLRNPWLGQKPAVPVPAGGIKFNRVGEAIEFYGADVMLLIGGSLYEAGDALLDRAKEFVAHAHQYGRDRGD